MLDRTVRKIEAAARDLKRQHQKSGHSTNIENFDLLSEPYKLALQVLDFSGEASADVARYLDKKEQTVEQIRRALGCE